MPNTLGNYDPVIYASEALVTLKRMLGLGSRVYRQLDPNPNEPGSTVAVRRPQSFTATSMPSSATDLTPPSFSISLDQWYGVKYTLSDKELAYSKERIIAEHVTPAARAVAKAIDDSLQALYRQVGWYTTATSPLAVADLTGLRKILLDNQCPMDDGALYLMLSPTLEEEALRRAEFAAWSGGGNQGVEALQSGVLRPLYGMQPFVTQNVLTHTAGVCADATGALTAEAAIGATSIAIDGVTGSGTFKAGDTLIIAGNTQRYSITADATASGGGAVTLSVWPQLVQTYPNLAVVTINLTSGVQSLGFHRDAFALVMGTLPDTLPAGAQSAAIFTAQDDQGSGLSVRATRWYDANNAAHYMRLDALWGVKCLNPNLACRLVD
jgi:hypothetical protein